MPHFGPRIVGQAAFEAAVKREKMSGGNHFGPRVTGVGLPPAPKRRENRQSPERRESAANKLAGEIPQAEGSLPAEELKKVLDDNSTFFDTLLEVEMARSDGPRREALLVFRAKELTTLNRPATIAEIDVVLGAMAPPPPATIETPKAAKPKAEPKPKAPAKSTDDAPPPAT